MLTQMQRFSGPFGEQFQVAPLPGSSTLSAGSCREIYATM